MIDVREPLAGQASLLAEPQCVHCGFCLPACPTYDVLGTEMDGPRGRLALMSALQRGTLAPDAPSVRHLDLCLGCLACETACPSGVDYSRRLEHTRGALHGSSARPLGQRLVVRAVLGLVAAPAWLQQAVFGFVRGAGLARVAAGPVGSRLLPAGLVTGARLALAGDRKTHASEAGTDGPAADDDSRRSRVGLLAGCIGRWLLPGVDRATRRVLHRAGFEVVVPPRQRCCGALHAHAGDLKGARTLARANIVAFERAGELDAIVVNAAGCGAQLKNYGHLFEGDPDWADRASRFAERVRDALELLGTAEPSPATGRLEASVAYHDACHLAHGQGIRHTPRDLLRSIPGLDLVPLEDCDRCCGSAGLYNLVHARVADMLLERKIVRLQESGATHVAAANPGCLLHLAAGLHARELPLRVVHPLELLDEAAEG
ncbi:MAG: (Fe-S)-binding protein [Planctomycetota bacterium]